MSGIYFDENRTHQIDLRKTIWSTDTLHNLYTSTIGNELSDVDWIGETESAMLLIELKNPKFTRNDNLCKCNGCDCDSCRDEIKTCLTCGKPVKKKAEKANNYFEFLNKACKKYYGGAFFLLSAGKNKPIKYYCIVNHISADSVWRSRATASIKRRLPFDLQNTNYVASKLIEDFKVLSVDEWNGLYPDFPLRVCSGTNP